MNELDQFLPQGIRSYELKAEANRAAREVAAKELSESIAKEAEATAERLRQERLREGGTNAVVIDAYKELVNQRAKDDEEAARNAVYRVQQPDEIQFHFRRVGNVVCRVSGPIPEGCENSPYYGYTYAEVEPPADPVAEAVKAAKEAKDRKMNEFRATMAQQAAAQDADTSKGMDIPKTDAERIAELEAQVADLTAKSKRKAYGSK
ncbi:hypothetical protein [Ruegeria sp. HKCCD6119]|uniref:hypothetical protein n=1 Tax=Ruegeria sp. HKCCD6119 TaxID=2683003 RepID=UPI001492A8EA|nr:hypothetical protein [Ruegeria sp. HKCCD6119]NOD83750.1 hypothetical protein [Ruegeria sp. HKCCD6119]